MSSYQFDTNNNDLQKKQNKSFFADRKAVEAEKEYQKLRLNTPINPDYRIQNPLEPKKSRNTADDIINHVWAIPSPKPAYDANRPEEIKRLMRNNALTNMFRTLGETFSLAKGGNVRRREPDQTNNQLLGAYWKSLDDYYNKMNDWQGQNYMNEIRKGLARVSQVNKDREYSNDLAKQKYDMWKDQRDWQDKKEKFDSDQNYRKWLKDKKLDDDTESKRRWWAEFGLKQKQDEDKKSRKIQTSQKTYDLTPEEASYYRNQATLNISELQKLHPEWVSRVPVLDEFGNNTGGYTYRLAPFVKDDDLIRSYLEMTEKAKNKPIPGIETSERPYFGYPSSDDQDNTQFSLPGLGGFKSTNASNKSSFMLPGF